MDKMKQLIRAMDETELDCYDWTIFAKTELAQAIVEALYEPTEDMLANAEAVVLTINKHEKIKLGPENIKKIWVAMLDGVLDPYA